MALDAVTSISKYDLLWDKAQVFLARTQMRQENVMIPDLGYTVLWNPNYNKYDDGGFVYYPGASLSGTGTSYGSMTAAGIWSLILCNVPTTDPRVQAALNWHKDHYTWDENPEMTPDGSRFQYYYYLAFSKALTMTVGEEKFNSHDWYADLSTKLIDLQDEDGHWVNTYTGHGGEGSPELCTTYSILSLQVREIPTEIKRLSWITFILRSNADLHIHDPFGRHAGKNYRTGEIEVQIPNATYACNHIQNITIRELESGNYRIVLVGTGTGDYILNVTGGVGEMVLANYSYTENITKGEIHDSTVNVAMITWLTIHVEEPNLIQDLQVKPTKWDFSYPLNRTMIFTVSEIAGNINLTNVIFTGSELIERQKLNEIPAECFSFTPNNFSVLAGSSINVLATLDLTSASVPSGTYSGTINVSSKAGNYAISVTVIVASVESATRKGTVYFDSSSGRIENLRSFNESGAEQRPNPFVGLPYGLFSFRITGLANNETVNVIIAFPENLSNETQYWKYYTPQLEWMIPWYQIPIENNDGDNIITVTLRDGGIGDDDGVSNGVIVHEGVAIGNPRPTWLIVTLILLYYGRKALDWWRKHH